MTSIETSLYLHPSFFSASERLIARKGVFEASTFQYASGVEGIRLKSDLVELIVLPYQGQQIWSVRILGRELTMKSMFDAPRLTQTFLETYGGFLLHCGATAMGVPSEKDDHPLHGELPNAPYQSAYLAFGDDDQGSYMAVSGQYRHTVAFNHNYLAEPRLILRPGSSLFQVNMTIKNLKHTPMELMYLAHINFRPVDHGKLYYTAKKTPEHVRVRSSIPSHVRPGPGYVEFLEQLKQHPEKHHILSPGLRFDPEVVFFIDYLVDENGWAHTVQLHPDGSGDYVAHRPDQLDHGVRWICRTADQDALGMIEPATAEPEGYLAEKAKGNLKIIPAEGQYHCDMLMGALLPAEARRIVEMIDRISGE
jgi:hypothetical protein